jgi:hypothetical protein
LAIPYSTRFVPGYFRKDSTAVSSWLDASIIKIVNGEQNGPNIISLHGTLPIEGIGDVFGMLTGEELPVYLKSDDNTLAKEAVSGAVVICVDDGKKERKYDLSNSMGSYKIDSLSDGDYTISIDKFGYANYSYDVTIGSGNQTHNVDAELIQHIPVGIKEKHIPDNIKVYPNPSDGTFLVQLNNEYLDYDISLLNYYGQSVSINKTILNNNPYTVRITTKDLSDGMYLIRIRITNKNWIKSIVIMK